MRTKPFIFGSSDLPFAESIGFSAGAIVVDNPTVQWLFFPTPIQRFIPPSGNAVIIAGVEQAAFLWQAPAGQTQPAATAGQFATILYVDSFLPPSFWAPGTGMNNPMTTAGDLIVGGTLGAPQRLGIAANGSLLETLAGAEAWLTPGSAAQVLTMVGGAPTWQTPSTLTTLQSILAGQVQLGGKGGAWQDILTLATGAGGTWAVIADLDLQGNASSLQEIDLQITDGTTQFRGASGLFATVAGAVQTGHLTIAAICSNPVANIKVQGKTTDANPNEMVNAVSTVNGVTKVSGMVGIKIA